MGRLFPIGACAAIALTMTVLVTAWTSLAGAQPDDQKILQDLTARLAVYVQQRSAARGAAPTADTPGAVEERLKAWGARTAGAGGQKARAGTVFTPEASELIRRRLQRVLQGPQVKAVREELAESVGEHIAAPGYEKVEVGLAVAAPELPFDLAEALPRLPQGLEYRFSGDRLLLRDSSTSVLVDLVPNALPVEKPSAPASRERPPGQPSPGAAAKVAPLALPNLAGSVKFAVLGDTGAGRDRDTILDGKYRAHAVAKMLEGKHAAFPFTFALMLGDNMYTDPDTPSKFREEVVEPYQVLRSKGVVFRAVLGNHDTVDFQLPLPELNFNNRRFYAFESGNVRMLILHSDAYMVHDRDAEQDTFLKTTLGTPFAGWTMAAFHHPLWSSGKHRNQNGKAREAYKLLLGGGARVVFTGHEHFYERTKPRPGLSHFVAGASAKLRDGDIERSEDFDAGFDDEHSAMLIEVAGDEMYFEAIGLSGRVRDCGVLSRTHKPLKGNPAAWMTRCSALLGS